MKVLGTQPVQFSRLSPGDAASPKLQVLSGAKDAGEANLRIYDGELGDCSDCFR